jgi:putative transposase
VSERNPATLTARRTFRASALATLRGYDWQGVCMRAAIVSLPRPVYPGSACMITRRCTQQQFLLRPSKETNNAVIYCLAVAAEKYEVDVMDFIHMSNHLHDGIFDRRGTGPAFYEHFHKLLAKCMNASLGRWENFFSSQQVNVVRLETREDLINKLVYIATNPVKDGLVEKVDQWPGASGYRALMTGEPLRATRPKKFFAENGRMPEEVTLYLRIPPELGDQEEILAEVRARVAAVEQEEARGRAQTGKKVLGRYAVLRQSWRDSPTKREPRRGLRPTIAAKLLWTRLEAIQRKREFIAQYRAARVAFLAGMPIPFPYGTYWLSRFVGVPVAPSEKLN